jgi:uncharacterized protein involved in type VI secretion and phage assembly
MIRAVIRDELRAFKTAELGIVTAAHSHESVTDQNNYSCDVRLRNSGLELKRVPVSTGRVGVVAIPNVDDMVLVQFLGGDVHMAIITARLYNDEDRPPEAKAQEFVYVSPDPARSGVRRLYMELPNGNTLQLDDDKLVVEMGQTTLTVNNGGDVAIQSAAKVTVESSGDTTINASGNLDLSAGGDVNVSGTNVSLKATAGATLQGTSSATVKGTAITLAGKTDFSPA